jgi:uncharacterized membrane protein YeaQ/YmgE (transglycosylase-associated protein family)
MLSILTWLVIGLILGFVARPLVSPRPPVGPPLTIGLGAAGAILGGLVSSAFWPAWTNQPDVNRMWPGWVLSAIGAAAVLWTYAGVAGRRELSATRR